MDVVKKELEEILEIEVLHWRSFFSRHWYILSVEDLSPETHIEQEKAEKLKRLSISCDKEDRTHEQEKMKINREQFAIKILSTIRASLFGYQEGAL